MGRYKEALEASQNAVEVYRTLAQDRRDSFAPNLARSLNNLGDRLNALGRRELALDVSEEAVTILLPFFRRFPAAFTHYMSVMVQNYEQRAQEAGREPDTRLLEQVAAVFEALKREEEEEET